MRLLRFRGLLLAFGLLMLSGCMRTNDDESSATEPSAVPAEEVTDLASGEAALAATLGCANYDEQSRQCLLLKIDYRVDTASGAGRFDRQALNIALVLDRSSSTQTDGRLADALAAAHWLVQNLTERDTLSIIAVDERATVLAMAGKVVNKPFLHHRLDDVFANGTADLAAGLREGMAQLRGSGADDHRKHVVLLTDSTAARAQAGNLKQLVKQASDSGISVSTLHVDKPEEIAKSLRAVLEDPLPIVARDAVIRVTMEKGYISKMYGQLPIAPAQTQTLQLGDLRATEHGFVIAQLEPAAFTFGTTVQARVSLEFADPLSGEAQTQELRLRSTYAPEARGSRDQTSTPAMLADVMAALETADSAARGLDFDRYRQAKASFESLRERAHQYAVARRDQELLNQVFVLAHLIEELDAANAQGLLHNHDQARAKLPNERDYLLYLFTHHRE